MKHYTRKLLASKFGVSLSGIRKALRQKGILPSRIKFSLRNLPEFLYSQLSIKDLFLLKPQLRKCSVCGNKFHLNLMQGTRCLLCYVKRYCNLIIYGKDTWDKIIKPSLVEKALQYLNSFRPTTK